MKTSNWTKVNGKPNLYKRNTTNGVELAHKQNFKTPDGKSMALYGYSSHEYVLTQTEIIYKRNIQTIPCQIL